MNAKMMWGGMLGALVGAFAFFVFDLVLLEEVEEFTSKYEVCRANMKDPEPPLCCVNFYLSDGTFSYEAQRYNNSHSDIRPELRNQDHKRTQDGTTVLPIPPPINSTTVTAKEMCTSKDYG